MIPGELVTEEKSGEITAAPDRPDSLNIENSIMTADAMGCQREIVKKVRTDPPQSFFHQREIFCCHLGKNIVE